MHSHQKFFDSQKEKGEIATIQSLFIGEGNGTQYSSTSAQQNVWGCTDSSSIQATCPATAILFIFCYKSFRSFLDMFSSLVSIVALHTASFSDFFPLNFEIKLIFNVTISLNQHVFLYYGLCLIH